MFAQLVLMSVQSDACSLVCGSYCLFDTPGGNVSTPVRDSAESGGNMAERRLRRSRDGPAPIFVTYPLQQGHSKRRDFLLS